MMTPTIPFTQYRRPHGEKRQQFFDCDESLANKAQAIIERGYCFEVEVLMNGIVSLTISNGKEDVAIELSPNGPEIPGAVERLVENFFDNLGTTP
jgi:hypothetical protein